MLLNLARLCKYDEVKGLKMERLSWIIHVAPKFYYMYPYKRDTEGDFTQKHTYMQAHTEKVMWRWSRKVFEDSGLEEWGGMTTNQGVPTITCSWVRQRTNIPPWASRRSKAWWHLILDFWLPELGGNKYLLCWATRFVVNCCSSHKELMYLDNGTLGLWNGIWNICLHD